jgi:hypothetical protein
VPLDELIAREKGKLPAVITRAMDYLISSNGTRIGRDLPKS